MTADADGLLAGIRALSGYLVGGATMGETLAKVAEIAQAAIPATHEVGITLLLDGRPGTYVFTDPDIVEVDQAQYETGDGPCLEAYDSGRTVLVRSTATSPAFRRFCRTAAVHGIRSTLSVPLTTPQGRLGAINLYARTEDAFDAGAEQVAAGFAEQVGFLLANAQPYWDARTLAENLSQAMESRAVIEQAKGIIIATTGCTADEAFDGLVQQSQHENVKLRHIAAEIVRRAQR